MPEDPGAKLCRRVELCTVAPSDGGAAASFVALVHRDTGNVADVAMETTAAGVRKVYGPGADPRLMERMRRNRRLDRGGGPVQVATAAQRAWSQLEEVLKRGAQRRVPPTVRASGQICRQAPVPGCRRPWDGLCGSADARIPVRRLCRPLPPPCARCWPGCRIMAERGTVAGGTGPLRSSRRPPVCRGLDCTSGTRGSARPRHKGCWQRRRSAFIVRHGAVGRRRAHFTRRYPRSSPLPPPLPPPLARQRRQALFTASCWRHGAWQGAGSNFCGWEATAPRGFGGYSW